MLHWLLTAFPTIQSHGSERSLCLTLCVFSQEWLPVSAKLSKACPEVKMRWVPRVRLPAKKGDISYLGGLESELSDWTEGRK